MSAAPVSRDDHLLLVPSPAHDALLVQVDDTGERRWPTVTGGRLRELDEVLADVGRLAGSGLVFLRSAGRAEESLGEPGAAAGAGQSPTRRTVLLVFDALAVPPADLPGPGRWAWCPLDDAASVGPALPAALEVPFARWVDELRGAPAPAQRPAWSNPGGIAPFLAWLDEEVRATGAAPQGDPEVLQQWGVSLVVRQRTDRGPLFGKAVGAVFATEPTITRLLARDAPGSVPDVLALDEERGWVLLADARIRPIAGAEAAEGLRALARRQRAWIGRTDALRAAGCPDRGPATLADDLAASLEDLELATELAPVRGLDGTERARLRALLPAFADLCREAEDDGAPLTLLHGDCHPGNVGVRDDGSVCILDWSDAAVGHPFVDVDVWLSHVADDERGALRDAYLAEWPEVADGEAALLRADVLCAAYQVVTSQRLLRALEEDEWPGFANGMSFWARRVLERYDLLVGAVSRSA
ncbi:phosphotransferase [Luteimicrobium sp. DT211]|uniref:phosphotransferase n=1 Tax=Luteimicrobium sp. DT211 TaxID=3393412 RepID=UPI003CE8220E